MMLEPGCLRDWLIEFSQLETRFGGGLLDLGHRDDQRVVDAKRTDFEILQRAQCLNAVEHTGRDSLLADRIAFDSIGGCLFWLHYFFSTCLFLFH
jgi:hypothetical protein